MVPSWEAKTSDGGYIVAGSTNSFGAAVGGAGLFHANAWVLKLNPDGSIAWQKTYGGSDDDFANSIQQTSDGEYIVAAVTNSFVATMGRGCTKRILPS